MFLYKSITRYLIVPFLFFMLTSLLTSGCSRTEITKEQAVRISKQRLDNYYNIQSMNLLEATPMTEKIGGRLRKIWSVKFDCDCPEENNVIIKIDKLSGQVIDMISTRP